MKKTLAFYCEQTKVEEYSQREKQFEEILDTSDDENKENSFLIFMPEEKRPMSKSLEELLRDQEQEDNDEMY